MLSRSSRALLAALLVAGVTVGSTLGSPALATTTVAAVGSELSLRAWEARMGLTSAGPLPYVAPARPATSDLYVSNLGSDSAPCTQGAPCRQISEALALVVPGETILVSNGSFLGFDVTVVATKADPVVIESPGRGSLLLPTVNRSDNRDTVHFLDADNVTLDGFQSYDANRAAVRIDTSDNITISNCTFGNDTTWGIFTDFDHNSTLEHNAVYGSVQQHGVYVSNSPIAPVIRWNLLYDNAGAGLQINADATQGGWGEQSGGDIEDNVIYDNGADGGAGINLDGNWNTRVVNNLLYDNHATGIANYIIDGFAGPHGMTIMDNTIVMASDGRWALQIADSTGENFVRNNLLLNLNPAHGGIEYGNQTDVNDTDSDYNVLSSITIDSTGDIYSLAEWQGMGYEPHSISATPAEVFVNYLANDYELSSTSPAIRAGEYLPNVTTDLLGNPRPTGQPSDIGAYQYVPPTLDVVAQATPTSGTVPLPVQFSATASGGTSPYTYRWDFGDGSSGSGAAMPEHTYNASGTFEATVTATDADGATAEATVDLTASSTTSPLSVEASGTPLDGSAPLTVAFSALASGGLPPYTYAWVFGDGTSGVLTASPTHVYEEVGNYTARLWANDTGGASVTENLSLEVTPATVPSPLVAHLVARPDPTAAAVGPEEVSFWATGGTGDYPSYVVEVEGAGLHQNVTVGTSGGPSLGGQSLNFTFPQSGTAAIRVTVTDSSGASASAGTNLSFDYPCACSDQASPPAASGLLGPYGLLALLVVVGAGVAVVVVLLTRRRRAPPEQASPGDGELPPPVPPGPP